MIILAPQDVQAARAGNRAALHRLVQAAEKPIYNLAIRMLAHPADAEDATQEILIKIITNLASLRQDEAAGAWAMQIACRHLVHICKKGRIEQMRFTFKGFAADLEQGLSHTDQSLETEIETHLALNDIKIGCTLAMLTCLKRTQRIVYILSDIFDLTDKEAAVLLNISPTTYRQRLHRSRNAVSEFTKQHCGNINKAAACRCEKRITQAINLGQIRKNSASFSTSDKKQKNLTELRAYIQTLEAARHSAALLRSNPSFASKVSTLVMQTIQSAPSL